jgi:anthranilate phosphoribosyltransferase
MEEKILVKGSNERKLRQHVTPLSAWALSIGTSIGWGSFVITSNTYLASAGPMGSAVGMLLGALRGEAGLPLEIVALNAGAALYVAGVADSIADGIARARQAVASGAAMATLDAFVATTRRLSRGG